MVRVGAMESCSSRQHVRGRKAYLVHGEGGSSGCWRGRQKGSSGRAAAHDEGQRRCALNAEGSGVSNEVARQSLEPKTAGYVRAVAAGNSMLRMRASLKGGADNDGWIICAAVRCTRSRQREEGWVIWEHKRCDCGRKFEVAAAYMGSLQ